MFDCKAFSLLKEINALKEVKKWSLEHSLNIW
jgi:hypothetical protein